MSHSSSSPDADTSPDPAYISAQLTQIGWMNWVGVRTLIWREILRFIKVPNQTILAPVVTTLLFLAVLVLALGGNTRRVAGVEFDQFIAPGLIMMAIVQNAFANPSSSLMLQKVQGVIVDLLMPPLTAGEIILSLIAGALVRGVLVGLTVGGALYVFVPYPIAHPILMVVYAILASTLMALVGILVGLWSKSFDHISAATNYVITPMAFLSGTFYSIRNLPEFWERICYYNPFFYMIDGFRYALVDYHDGSTAVGISVLTVCCALLTATAWYMLHRGYRLKS